MQKVGTKSAKRKLKKISGKERRFKKDTTNHVISKAIVSKAKGTARAICMEDLKYIRYRAPVRGRRQAKETDIQMVIWRVKKLCDIQKKEGEYIDQRSRNEFECLQRGFKEMADCIGVLNIKKRIGSSQ